MYMYLNDITCTWQTVNEHWTVNVRQFVQAIYPNILGEKRELHIFCLSGSVYMTPASQFMIWQIVCLY